MAFDTFDTDAGIVATGVVFSNANLTATGGAGFTLLSSGIAQAVEGKKSGKWYVEFTLNVASGNVDGCGVVTSWGCSGYIGQSVTSAPAGDVGWGYFTNQNIAHLNTAQTAVNNTVYGAGAVIGIAIDLDNKRVWWRLNTGGWIGTAGTPNPATNTGGFDISFLLTNNCRVYPAVNLSGPTTQWTANFGASSFTGAVPSGFTAGWTNTTAGTYFGTFASSGRTTATASPPQNNKAVSPYTATFTGPVASFTIPFAGGTIADQKGVIYDATGVGGLPGALLGVSTNTIASGNYGEQTFTFSGVSVVSGVKYWFGVVSDVAPTGFINVTLCIPFTSGIAFNSGTYASPTNPFGASPSVANNRYPIMVFPGAPAASPLVGAEWPNPQSPKRARPGDVWGSNPAIIPPPRPPFFGSADPLPIRGLGQRLELYSAFNPSLYSPASIAPFFGLSDGRPIRKARWTPEGSAGFLPDNFPVPASPFFAAVLDMPLRPPRWNAAECQPSPMFFLVRHPQFSYLLFGTL